MKKAATIRVIGKVQGVGFRYNTKLKADEYGVLGYVKNDYDGTVYIEAEGEEERLEQFIQWCWNGPGWASVRDLRISYCPLMDYDKFKIK